MDRRGGDPYCCYNRHCRPVSQRLSERTSICKTKPKSTSSLHVSDRIQKEDREVKVIRGGRPILLSIYEILVGDVLLLEAGDIVPVDAILAEGHDIRCDESSVTGESNTLKKTAADVALENS